MASGFVVSARKYRPGTFADVVGQEHVANTLRNGLKQDQLGHAFLFTGPRGVGKTTCARILAKAINCQNLTETGDPCNACDSCRNFNEGRSLNIFELDAASNNSVEDIRQLIERLRYVPQGGAKSVYIIDEVHMLSTAAFNAFLKTLEEPPPHALFILATTEKHKILPTILSRCQKFDFRRIQVDDIAQRLQWICEEEHIEAEYDALQLIGLKADGALRDALSIFDQIVNFSGGHLTYQSVLENLNVLDYEYYFRLVHCMAAEDHPQALLLLNEVIHKGFEPINFLMGLVEHFRNLLVAYEPGTVALLETSDGVKQRYLEQSQLLPPNVLLNAFNLASEAEQKIRSATLPRLTVELLLLKLTHLPQVLSLATLPETDGQKKKVAKPELAPPVAATTAATIPAPSVQPAYTATPSGDGPGSVPQVEAHPAAYTLPQASPQVRLVPDPNDRPVQAEAHPAPPAKRAGTRRNALQLDLDALDAMEEERAQPEEILVAQPIAPHAFRQALDQFVAEELGDRRMLGAALRAAPPEFDLNTWICRVRAEINRIDLEKAREELVSYLRAKTENPTLVLEILLDPSLSPPEDVEKPLTAQERLVAMMEKNPELARLVQHLNLQLIY